MTPPGLMQISSNKTWRKIPQKLLIDVNFRHALSVKRRLCSYHFKKVTNEISLKFNYKITFMKKILFLTLIFGAIISTNVYAQAGDPPSMLQQTKEKISPLMVEKTGLTMAQADKIVEINYEMRETMQWPW